MFHQLIVNSESTTAIVGELFSLLSKFEFSRGDSEMEMHMAVNDFKMQLSQQPIEFTFGGFYAVSRTFMASVRKTSSLFLKEFNLF